MAVRIRQLNIAYVPVQDRLLLRVNTTENSEYRLWFTRHFIRVLWPEVIKILTADPQVQVQGDKQKKQAVLSFKHEKALSQSNFSRKYDENVEDRPLGTSPLLVSVMRIKATDSAATVLAFQNPQGRGVELFMDQDLLHSFCKLLCDTVEKANWELNLNPLQAPIADYSENRVLN
jgi:hypothetical protein